MIPDCGELTIDGVDIVDPSMINKYKFDKIIITPLFVEETSE